MSISTNKMDVLQEIGNIGVGNAATALANLLQTRVDIGLPQVQFLTLEDAIGRVGGIETPVVCVIVSVGGQIDATVLYIFKEQDMYLLIDLLTGLQDGSTRGIDEMGRSVTMEIGNILTGSFLSAISDMTGLRLTPSVPWLAHDMLGAVLPAALLEFGYAEDQVLMIKTTFSRKTGSRIDGHFFLLPDVNSLDQLFDSLGIAY